MQTTDSLFLFKALIKAGALWQGDVLHRKWSERLYFSEDQRAAIETVLKAYDPVNDYHFEDCSVWIA